MRMNLPCEWKEDLNWVVLSGYARFSNISQYLVCFLRCVHHPPTNNMLGTTCGTAWRSELPWYSLCIDFPPHFVQALRGKGVFPTGRGFGSGARTTWMFYLDFHKVSEGTVLDLCNSLCQGWSPWIPELCRKEAEVGGEGLQGKQASPRKKCHQIVTALLLQRSNSNL